ncbi:MAG: hypothetical protein ABSF24_05970 [Candidatus Bathyarchaeia archaeon]
MRIQKEVRAVTTLLAVLLILASAIVGGFISYMFAVSPFFAVPNNVSLGITGASFSVNHPDYFDITVLNPSYSPSGTNITSIYLKIDGETGLFNVTDTVPGLPTPLDPGASTAIRCYWDWGSYAGRSITVNVLPQNGTGVAFTVQTDFVKLDADTYFNATESVTQFNVTVTNELNSVLNLTINNVVIDYTPVSNLSIALPMVLDNGQTVKFTCFFDWQGYVKPLVEVDTIEGYKAQVQKNVSSVIDVEVAGVTFNETNPSQVSVTLSNSANSVTPVDIANITITYSNITDVINGTLSNPPLPYRLDINNSVTLNCVWNWTDESYRNLSVNVTAYTNQGFVSQPTTVITPAEVAARIDHAEFDLDHTGRFTVNMTNLSYSLQTINVTEIDFNQNSTGTDSALVAAGGQATFVCEFNWSSFVGQNVAITANVTYGVNNSLLVPFQVNVPYFSVMNVSFGNFSLGNPYMNVNVTVSEFSKIDANITQIFIQTGNATQTIDGTISNPKISPSGYPLAAGNEISVVCPWDWKTYVGNDVTVIVQTADGFQSSTTLKVQ